jgi:membrane-associated phospholipid phosphatase
MTVPDTRRKRPTGRTILPWPAQRHKARALVAVVGLICLCAKELGAVQAAPPPRHRLEPKDLLLGAAAAGLYATPHALGINHHPPDCVPCDAQTVPWFDRWAITDVRSGWGTASSGVVLALAALETLDLSRSGPDHYAEVAYLAESAAWALGSSELMKALVARKRPVLYTSGASAAAPDLESQRSWPSGHTAVAFALATSYFLAPRDARAVPAWRRWAALGAATSVGLLRVLAGQHFPSDVVSGAALGAASALTVRTIRF